MNTMNVTTYTTKGQSAGEAKVSEAVFGAKLNQDLIHQVMLAMRANRRLSTADAKDRSEVRGTGKKPWRQKGTGRARHGSRRSPIWVGGGITHGPTSEKDFSQKVNRKMRSKALFSALSEKVRNGQVLFVDALPLEDGKTKTAEAALKGLESVEGFATINTRHKANNIFVALPDSDEQTKRALNNLPHVRFDEVRNLNLLDVLDNRYLVIINPALASETLEKRGQVARKGLSVTEPTAAE
jgi:large subunit ribosomal protein L4